VPRLYENGFVRQTVAPKHIFVRFFGSPLLLIPEKKTCGSRVGKVPQIGNLRKRNKLPTCCTRKPADGKASQKSEKPARSRASRRVVVYCPTFLASETDAFNGLASSSLPEYENPVNYQKNESVQIN
jgi:hypothetical protein